MRINKKSNYFILSTILYGNHEEVLSRSSFVCLNGLLFLSNVGGDDRIAEVFVPVNVVALV